MPRRTLLTFKTVVGAMALGIVVVSLIFAATKGRPQKANTQKTTPADLDRELKAVEDRVDQFEANALAELNSKSLDSLDSYEQVTLLGELLLFDKQLSVKRNMACASCHMPETGFTGPISSVNLTTVSYPGSVHTRHGARKPQSYGYATFAPVLHYNQLKGDFVGGNFWDMRATGIRLQSPTAEQAQGPPLNPLEMGLPDSACMVYRVSQRPYKQLFEKVWGKQAFAIKWAGDVEKACSTPGPAPTNDPFPVHLGPIDRDIANLTFDQIALAIAAYEASPDVNPFTSKYDYVQAGKAQFTSEEKAGYDLFRGKAKCNECHRDGGPTEEPLFTDFTATNLGVPRNSAVPFFTESKPDPFGYIANSPGANFIDTGVGGFLNGAPNTAWKQYAPQFNARFQVATLRNVDMRPRSDFVKAYMHNGYFKSLKEVIHFYNTRDVLPGCKPNDPGEKVSCWPAPEDSSNLNKTQLGKLGLTNEEENSLVSFLKTLTDGFKKPK
jgi:cytochrome c peroxidase